MPVCVCHTLPSAWIMCVRVHVCMNARKPECIVCMYACRHMYSFVYVCTVLTHVCMTCMHACCKNVCVNACLCA